MLFTRDEWRKGTAGKTEGERKNCGVYNLHRNGFTN